MAFSGNKKLTYNRMKCLLSARPQTYDSYTTDMQNIHENRQKGPNGSVDMTGRQLKSNMPHMVLAGLV